MEADEEEVEGEWVVTVTDEMEDEWCGGRRWVGWEGGSDVMKGGGEVGRGSGGRDRPC